MNKLYRTSNKELRFDEESRTIEGYAVVFDCESVTLSDGCTETIERSAIDEELIKNSDVHALIDHDANRPLARSKKGKGSLELSIDETGLFFRCSLPKNKYGDEALELIQRGDIDACSFCFSYADDDPESRSYDRANGHLHRSIKKIDGLYDVSIVHYPAYPQTSVSARSSMFDECERVDHILDAIETEINAL